jgi:Protein of unknown function (DUF1360)
MMVPYALALLFLGLANWLATTVLVEAEVTRDYRDWINKKYEQANEFPTSRSAWAWYKLKYLVGCHLCTGVWVGFAMALFIPPIVSVPFVGYVLTALTIKAIGHATLVFHKWGESVSSLHNATTEARKRNAEREAAFESAANFISESECECLTTSR